MYSFSNVLVNTSRTTTMITWISVHIFQLACLHCVLMQISILGVAVVGATPRVEATAPLNPIENGGVLGLHCQVWNLDSGHELTIIRRVEDEVERLSSGDGLTHSTEDRVFLAPRQLGDGSVVYFLSIMLVTRKDEGVYSCRIVNIAEGNVVTADSVTLHVTYFPSDSDPSCSPSDQVLKLYEGSTVVLNCSSEAAFPHVSLSWTRVGSSDEKYRTTDGIASSGRLFSTLVLTATRMHNEAVFLCHINSVAFPGRTRTCHVGPITIIPNGNFKPGLMPPIGSNDNTNHPIVTRLPGGGGHDDSTNIVTKDLSIDQTNCAAICSSMNTSNDAFFWIIATIVGAVLALTFFAMGVCLLVKYYRLPQAPEASRYVAVQQPCHDIYAELDGRGRSEGKVYMTLEQADKSNRLIEIQHDRVHHSHYDVMPNLPKL